MQPVAMHFNHFALRSFLPATDQDSVASYADLKSLSSKSKTKLQDF